MILVLAAVVGVIAFAMLWKEIAAKNRPKKLSKVAAGAAGVFVAMLLLLTATGRLHWLAALAAGALPLLRWVLGFFAGQMIRGWLGNIVGLGGFNPFQRAAAAGGAAPGGSGPNASSVATDDLAMTLDHASGEMDGEVLSGPRRGERLSELDLDALTALYDEFQAADSQQLLGAYLDRRFPGWRDAQQPPASAGSMDTQQALAVLGLEAGASETEIVGAHRRLMQKLHPDRGGTDYLAATLNHAKEVLLDGANGAGS